MSSLLAVSIDFGRKATAVVTGGPYALPHPSFMDCDVISFPPISSAMDASAAMKDLFHNLVPFGVYLLEEQSKPNTDTPMMEAAFAALASTVPGALVVHVPVSRVANEFHLPRGCGYAAKKKAAEAAMRKYVAKHPNSVSDRIREAMEELDRVHDLADAFLQLLWFARVGKNEIQKPSSATNSRCVRATDPKYKRAEEKRKEKKEEKRKRAASDLKKRPAEKRRKL